MNKVFRVFLSSTFDDWIAEREHLRKEVFPSLRDDCEKKGGRLLPVDLRWGISEEAGKAHATVDICLDEVRRCCDVSPKPNFLIFLGNRYGWRPLPPKLSETQWKGLKALKVIKEERENCLFQKWYKLDNNAEPHEYCLKPQSDGWVGDESKMRAAIDSAYWDDDNKEPSKTWDETFTPHAEQPWQDDTPWLVGSVVEQELLHVLKIHDERRLDKSHIHAFIREIDFSDVGLNKCLEKLSSYKCADNLTGVAREVDNMLPYTFTDQGHPIADYRLKKLKDDIEKWLGKDHVIRVNDKPYHWAKCDWKANERPEVHNESFGEAVKSALEETIKKELKEDGNQNDVRRPDTTYFIEPEQGLVKSIKKLSDKPILLFGKAGSGKSTLLSKVVEFLEEGKSTVYDFWMGLDEHCSTGEGLLRSMIGCLLKEEEPKEELSGKSFHELKEIFHKLCEGVGENIWITVDALDQLPEGDPAKRLNWLPQQENIHIIVSTLDAAIKDDFEKANEKCSVVEIGGLDGDKAGGLLRKWLDDEKRKLTDEQQAALLETYNGTPLHLKLLFERAKLLKSYDPIPAWLKQGIGIGTDTSIKSLFDHLASKEKHGSELVARALSYIAATPYGVPEDVLLELLRADSTLVKSFEGGKYWRETDEKIPEIVWSRLYHDLEPFLARRSFYGEEYLDFYHAEFRRVTLHKVDPWVDQEVMLSCRQNIEDLSGTRPKGQLSGLDSFLFHHSVESAVYSKDLGIITKAMGRLCSLDYLMNRLELTQSCKQSSFLELEVDYDRLINTKPIKDPMVINMWSQWMPLMKSKFHYFWQSSDTWQAYKMLLQFAFESVHEDVVKQAELWWKKRESKWLWAKASEPSLDARLFSFGSPFQTAVRFDGDCILLQTPEYNWEAWRVYDWYAECESKLFESEVEDHIESVEPISSNEMLVQTASEKRKVWNIDTDEISAASESLDIRKTIEKKAEPSKTLDGRNYVAYFLGDTGLKVSCIKGNLLFRKISDKDIKECSQSVFVPLTPEDEWLHMNPNASGVVQSFAPADGCICNEEGDVISWKGNRITYWVYDDSSKGMVAEWDSEYDNIHTFNIRSFKMVSTNRAISVDEKDNTVFWDDLFACSWKKLKGKLPVNAINTLDVSEKSMFFYSHISESLGMTVVGEIKFASGLVSYWQLPEWTVPLLISDEKVICGDQASLQVYALKEEYKYGGGDDFPCDYPIKGMELKNGKAYSYSENGQVKRWDLSSGEADGYINIDEQCILNGLEVLSEWDIAAYGSKDGRAWLSCCNLSKGSISSIRLGEGKISDLVLVANKYCVALLGCELVVIKFHPQSYLEPKVKSSVDLLDSYQSINHLNLDENIVVFWFGQELIVFKDGLLLTKKKCWEDIDLIKQHKDRIFLLYENKGFGIFTLNEPNQEVDEYDLDGNVVDVRAIEGKGLFTLSKDSEVAIFLEGEYDPVELGAVHGLFVSFSLDDAVAWYVDGDCLPVSLVEDIDETPSESKLSIDEIIRTEGFLICFKGDSISVEAVEERLTLNELKKRLDAVQVAHTRKSNITIEGGGYNAALIQENGEQVWWYGYSPHCFHYHDGKFVVVDGQTTVKVLGLQSVR